MDRLGRTGQTSMPKKLQIDVPLRSSASRSFARSKFLMCRGRAAQREFCLGFLGAPDSAHRAMSLNRDRSAKFSAFANLSFKRVQCRLIFSSYGAPVRATIDALRNRDRSRLRITAFGIAQASCGRPSNLMFPLVEMHLIPSYIRCPISGRIFARGGVSGRPRLGNDLHR
jgi:hypothetical protein